LALGEARENRWRGFARSPRALATERSQSLAVVGPTLSGKTSSLAIPALLSWEGPIVAASVKTDLVRHTVQWRRSLGTVWCFDPSSSTGLEPATWSPLPAARTWPGALRVAASLTEVTRHDSTGADGDFWYSTAAKCLAPLLFAAANAQRSMTDVVRWVDTQEMVEVAEILEALRCPEAFQAARATWQRDERQRSSVYTTAETVLEAFAGSSTHAGPGGQIDVEELLDGPNTLYICAPAHDQRRLRGLFSALVKQVLDAAFVRGGGHAGPLDPPLLVVLDEAANIAPLAELDGLAATCAGHGIQLVTVWQDLAQVHARYGARAATVINNHRARLFLSGIGDPGTLDFASQLIGDEECFVPTTTRDARGAHSTTITPQQRRLLYGALPPVRLRLTPWWQDVTLAARGGLDPADSGVRPGHPRRRGARVSPARLRAPRRAAAAQRGGAR
jgi:type IV secretion system protein VirD4